MRMSIGTAARLSGVSVRTLRYYDQIGLLHPSETAENGYRYYSDQDVARLQEILFFRELDFPLREIVRILSLPGYDRQDALRRQRSLLMLKRQRLDRLLALLDDNLKGDFNMQLDAFDRSDFDRARRQYAEEARSRWGSTQAWAESRRKEETRTAEEQTAMQEEMNDIFRAFAALRDQDPADDNVQQLVADWQNWITRWCYQCDREILAGLGEMYTADERFTQNIDRFGAGTAAFLSRAIAIYCDQADR